MGIKRKEDYTVETQRRAGVIIGGLAVFVLMPFLYGELSSMEKVASIITGLAAVCIAYMQYSQVKREKSVNYFLLKSEYQELVDNAEEGVLKALNQYDRFVLKLKSSQDNECESFLKIRRDLFSSCYKKIGVVNNGSKDFFDVGQAAAYTNLRSSVSTAKKILTEVSGNLNENRSDFWLSAAMDLHYLSRVVFYLNNFKDKINIENITNFEFLIKHYSELLDRVYVDLVDEGLVSQGKKPMDVFEAVKCVFSEKF